ncbi:hypothetical protein BDU57DRAFT_510919 [Ampelomyces quisqualis]|uniref:Uncharacterized protein n=1 Tax=Ampelomyces quisqualis TaxID=50730 RepID=A0A6A5R1H1_AMPQU|nr:hypothetical protein BDU57DRAFT_510919 [Ampelomyces quisqualis]
MDHGLATCGMLIRRNLYNSFPSPKYSIAISIDGDTWSIPGSIERFKHFTVSDFQAAIKAAAGLLVNLRDPDRVGLAGWMGFVFTTVTVQVQQLRLEEKHRDIWELSQHSLGFMTHQYRDIERIRGHIGWLHDTTGNEDFPSAMRELYATSMFSSLWILEGAYPSAYGATCASNS